MSWLLLFLFHAVVTSATSPDEQSRRAGEAYGQCVAGAARQHGGESADLDVVMARALADCAAEGDTARRAYRAYLLAEGIEMSAEQVDRLFADGLPQLRRRIEGCLEATRANRADGGERRC